METTKQWVALLDEDEDDFVYWQHGFNAWATHLEIRWFHSLNAFLSTATLGQSKPVALVLDGIMPRGEEMNWLSTLLLHPSSQQAAIIMLSEEIEQPKHQAYMNLGAADHLRKPHNQEALKEVVLAVSNHVAAKA